MAAGVLTNGFPVSTDKAVWPGILLGGNVLMVPLLLSITGLTTCTNTATEIQV